MWQTIRGNNDVRWFDSSQPVVKNEVNPSNLAKQIAAKKNSPIDEMIHVVLAISNRIEGEIRDMEHGKLIDE
jgi:hypothetical protein